MAVAVVVAVLVTEAPSTAATTTTAAATAAAAAATATVAATIPLLLDELLALLLYCSCHHSYTTAAATTPTLYCTECRHDHRCSRGRAHVRARARRRRRSHRMRRAAAAVNQHGQIATLGSSQARLRCLLSARVAAPGSSALPELGPATVRAATASGARASRLIDRRFRCVRPSRWTQLILFARRHLRHMWVPERAPAAPNEAASK